jgi:hypothetical protein
VQDVCQWLSLKGLEQCIDVIREERVDGATLLCLNRKSAKELTPTIGLRRILLKELSTLLGKW